MKRHYHKQNRSNYTDPYGGGFSRRPGQYESRNLTPSGEITRVLLIVGAQAFLGFLALISLYMVVAIVGPITGYVTILTVLIILWGRRIHIHPIISLAIAPLGVLWFIGGYVLCEQIWVANPAHFFHPFAQGLIAIMFGCVSGLSGWGVYILFLEVTDPNWPSPRAAVLRDGPFIPGHSIETYGGQLLPDGETLQSLPSRTITVQLDKEGDGKHIESVAHIPDNENWTKFFFAVAHHGKRFTEATALAYSVPLKDTRDGTGRLIAVGMRTLREWFLARGWLKWKSETHERGVEVTPKGMVILKKLGGEGD